MNPDENFAIKVSEVNKSFKLPHEKQSSLKGLLLNVFKGKRTFEKQHVLKNINLEIGKGEFFGIVGKNGGGKSTMLKLLSGIYSPDTGAVVVNGKLTAFIELGVGFNPNLTGRENIFLSGALLGFSEKEVIDMYDDIVKFAELKRFMDQKLKNYSSGMQVRLAFSIAIRAKSDILILDEVLAVGDAAFQQKCYNYFEELKKMNQTVVFVSHDMSAVRRFCTRAVYIKGGKLIETGSPEDIAAIYVEDNLDLKDEVEDPTLPEGYSIRTKIAAQDDLRLEIEVSYNSKDNDPVYVGLAVVKDGVSIAEITTPPEKPLSGKGKIYYKLDKTVFNSGAYRIGGASLFRVENRELVSTSPHRVGFVIKGSDIRRGGALKLADSWADIND